MACFLSKVPNLPCYSRPIQCEQKQTNRQTTTTMTTACKTMTLKCHRIVATMRSMFTHKYVYTEQNNSVLLQILFGNVKEDQISYYTFGLSLRTGMLEQFFSLCTNVPTPFWFVIYHWTYILFHLLSPCIFPFQHNFHLNIFICYG